ncbi:hypothetical protein B0H14DRAFT_2567846 [Mycena olivaceomarginata]|nr:hypothetical protein B0H14DRAFT_2567846 [Mycena olivaceomarginata]
MTMLTVFQTKDLFATAYLRSDNGIHRCLQGILVPFSLPKIYYIEKKYTALERYLKSLRASAKKRGGAMLRAPLAGHESPALSWPRFWLEKSADLAVRSLDSLALSDNPADQLDTNHPDSPRQRNEFHFPQVSAAAVTARSRPSNGSLLSALKKA